MTLKNILITVLIGVAVVMGTTAFYNDMSSTYRTLSPSLANSTSSSNFTMFSNATTRLTAKVDNLHDYATNPGERINIPLLTQVYDAGVLFIGFAGIVLEIPAILINLLDMSIKFLGAGVGIALPGWFRIMLTTIISVIFVFTVASFLLKRGEI